MDADELQVIARLISKVKLAKENKEICCKSLSPGHQNYLAGPMLHDAGEYRHHATLWGEQVTLT